MLLYNTSESTLWIVGTFLLVTLVIGLYTGRGIKDIKEYALGNGRFTSFTMVLTMLATWIGGESIIGSTSEIFSKGIILSFSWLAVGLQFFLIGAFLSKRLTSFKNVFTIGDLIGIFFGKPIKVFAGILISIRGIFVISVQLLMLGRVFENFFSVNSYWGVILGGFILSIYSIIGGIKSVTKTDVFQFIILIIAVPLLLTFLLNKIGSYKDLFIKLPNSKLFQISNHNLYHSLSYITFLGLFFTSFMNPAMMQRNFMTSNAKKLRNQYFTLSVLVIVMGILFTLIGLSMAVLYPDINRKVVIFHAINNLNLSSIIRSIIISGFIAVIMSTADSCLHSTSLCVYRDILDPFFKFKKKQLIAIKLITILVTILTILAALFFINTSYFRNIHFFAALIVLPILHFPLIAGILGLKTDIKSLIAGSIAAILTLCFSYNKFPNLKVIPIILSILSNMLAYMISHILQNKGIAWVKRAENKKEETKLWIPSPQKILDSIINSIPTPRKIYEYSRFQVMKNGSQNIIFGIYCCINFTLPYFLWDHQDPEKFNMMTNLRFIGGIMAGLLIVKDQWKEFLKPYYPLYWHITLTYCLPFITTVMFLMTGGSLSWLMNVGTSIFFLIMLVTGEVFLILAPLGLGLGIIFYSYFIGPINLSSLGFDINYFLFYQVFFSTLIGLLFAYRKRISYIKQGNIGLNLGESLCHELRNTLYSLSCNQFNRARMEQILDQGTKQIEGKKGYFIQESLFKSFFEQTNEAINFDENTIKVISTFEKLFRDYKTSLASPKVYSMKSIVNYTLKELHFLPGQKERVELNLKDDFFAQIPKEPFAFVLSNLIRNAFKHGGRNKVQVTIKLEDHKLIISDNGQGIPSSNLEKVFQMHYTTGQKGDSTGIGLGFSKIIVNSFYGEIWCESEEGKDSYTEFHIKFPEVSPSKITEESLSEMKDEGVNEGERNQKERFAIKMLKDKRPIKEIFEYTDLSRSQIEDLKSKL